MLALPNQARPAGHGWPAGPRQRAGASRDLVAASLAQRCRTHLWAGIGGPVFTKEHLDKLPKEY